MISTLLLATLSCLVAPAQSHPADPPEDGPFGPRRALAFYYAWYGNPEVSGVWRHWEGVDADRRSIGSSTNYPVAGAYDSADPAVIERHLSAMSAAGLDGPIVSWWGPDAPDSDRILPAILQAADRHALVVSAYYETIPAAADPVGRAARDLAYLVDRYGAHPRWLRVDGRPVVFLYVRALEELGAVDRWAEVRRLVRARTGVDPFLVGDAVDPEAAEVFDGLHHYNTADRIADQSPEVLARTLLALARLDAALARSADRLACATVIPGYDDTKIRTPGLAVPRFDGRTYAAGWEAATAAGADWALVTSWNEWHEGSELEPSIEHGDRELSVTSQAVARFKDAPIEGDPVVPADAAWAEFAAGWRGGTIGLLGGTGLATPGGELALGGLPTRAVSLRALCAGDVSAADVPILVYLGGEEVASDLGERQTLPEALRRFAAEGGVLIVASPQAWPFYRDRTTGTAGWSEAIGLTVRPGFERPPADGPRFAFRGPLAELGSAPYPTRGDLRFRPITPPPAGATFEPLADLIDPNGNALGAAAAVVTYTDGPFAPTRLIYTSAPLWRAGDAGYLLRAILREAASRTAFNPREE